MRLRGDAYLLDEFHVVASGGSSGQRGVFVYGWDAWATCYSSIARFPVRDRKLHPELASRPPVVAAVAAAKASHISAAIGATFSTPDRPRHSIPVSQPIEQIVDRLNHLQPTTLMGYSSFLPRLAAEARARRLRIAPQRVVAISEPLLPEAARRSRSDVGCTGGERLRHVRGSLRRLLRARVASARRPVPARTGRRGRDAGRGRCNLREGVRHQSLQHRRAAHPVRGHRRSHGLGRTMSVRVGVSTDRGPARTTRRHVHLSGRHRDPPARVSFVPRPPTSRRVSGPPDRTRRRHLRSHLRRRSTPTRWHPESKPHSETSASPHPR